MGHSLLTSSDPEPPQPTPDSGGPPVPAPSGALPDGPEAALTPDAVDGQGVELLFAMLALAREVGDGLHLAVKEVVQQRERHLLGRAAVGADVQHVGGDDGAAHPHLRVVLVPQPRAVGVVLWKTEGPG